jgi:hypothetical protein
MINPSWSLSLSLLLIREMGLGEGKKRKSRKPFVTEGADLFPWILILSFPSDLIFVKNKDLPPLNLPHFNGLVPADLWSGLPSFGPWNYNVVQGSGRSSRA